MVLATVEPFLDFGHLSTLGMSEQQRAVVQNKEERHLLIHIDTYYTVQTLQRQYCVCSKGQSASAPQWGVRKPGQWGVRKPRGTVRKRRAF